MKFVQEQGVWHLIDETTPERAFVIATLRNELEVLALREFCQLTLRDHEHTPEHFQIRYKETEYTVTPLGSPGEKLALSIVGNGFSSLVSTEFMMPGKGNA